MPRASRTKPSPTRGGRRSWPAGSGRAALVSSETGRGMAASGPARAATTGSAGGRPAPARSTGSSESPRVPAISACGRPGGGRPARGTPVAGSARRASRDHAPAEVGVFHRPGRRPARGIEAQVRDGFAPVEDVGGGEHPVQMRDIYVVLEESSGATLGPGAALHDADAGFDGGEREAQPAGGRNAVAVREGHEASSGEV